MGRDWRTEHLDDPRDMAGAFFLLDEGEAQLAVAPCCGKFVCSCDEEEPEKFRRYRSVRRRSAEERA